MHSPRSVLHIAARFRLAVAVWATAVLLPVDRLPAQTPRTDFVREVIDPDMLPDSRVAALAQTRDGYLWLGTRGGLVRYDGLKMTTFTPSDTRALPAASVNALYADSSGRLWISTNRGLAVREHDRFRGIAPEQIPASAVWKVLQDRKGRLWVSGAFGVRVGDGTHFTPVPGLDEHIYALAEDASGRIWMGGRNVLASYAEGEAAPVRWEPAMGRRVYDLAFDSSGFDLWIATREGIAQLDVRKPAAIVERERISTAIGALRAQVWSLALDHRGNIWVGTDTRGVLVWDGRTLSSASSTADRTIDPVWWIMHDMRGNMWVGTSGGLERYKRSAFRTITSGLTSRSVWSVRGDADGTVWIAPDDGQILWLDGDRWRPMFSGLFNRSAQSTWPLRRGGLLTTDDDGLVFEVTRRGITPRTSALGFPGRGPLGLFEDTDGSIIAPTSEGVLRSRNGKIDSAYRDFGLTAAARPRVFERHHDGRLLIGDPWLTIVDGARVQRFGAREGLTDSAVTAVLPTAASIWIATADSGLYVLRDGRVRNVRAANPYLQRGINGLVADDLGNLWLTSRSGLLRASLISLEQAADGARRDVTVRLFDRTDGLPTTDINSDYQSQLYRDRDGNIWLPTYAGPVVFDPAAIVRDTLTPQVHIERVIVDGELQPEIDSVRTLKHPSRLEITFAATDALVPSRVRAEYRVIGVDSAWTSLGTLRTLSFGPLVGGSYRVEIRVAGEEGNWSPAIATVSISVPLTLRERAWFAPLLSFVALLVAYGVVRLRLTRARARETALSALVAERTAALEASRAQLEARVAERTEALGRELTERYRLEQRLESTRRMASLGRLAGGVSHEINNALATVLGFAQLAQLASRKDDRVQADLGEVVRAGRRAASITHQLLAFARQHHTELVPAELDQVIRDNLRSLEQMCAPLHIVYSCTDSVPMVGADLGQIEQLLVNLVKNARDARPRDGQILIALEEVELDSARAVGDRVLPSGRYAVLSVRDHGTGISPAALEHLFEPFFTTKDVNEGSGLGLAVVQGIVARHDGAIDVRSEVGEGTTFSMWFPELPSSEKAFSSESDVPRGNETVLLVEDDSSIRQLCVRMLAGHGYRVLDAEDGSAARTLVGKSIESIDVVVTDIMMPNTNGVELARLLRAARPDLPFVFMTGYAGLPDEALDELRTAGPVLPKPFTREALLWAVRRALDARRTDSRPVAT